MSHLKNSVEDWNDTVAIAETFYEKLTKQFGVTFHQDHAGEFGEAGKIYLTLRHTDKTIGDCHITLVMQKISRGMV